MVQRGRSKPIAPRVATTHSLRPAVRRFAPLTKNGDTLYHFDLAARSGPAMPGDSRR
ncbi:hypothetical protein OKW46_004216 [Paraburkholderia sp. WSM4179]|nr:hypothetical protein [Paraburkholderia sp. WSM4179]